MPLRPIPAPAPVPTPVNPRITAPTPVVVGPERPSNLGELKALAEKFRQAADDEGPAGVEHLAQETMRVHPTDKTAGALCARFKKAIGPGSGGVPGGVAEVRAICNEIKARTS